MADVTYNPIWNYAGVAADGSLNYGTIREAQQMILRLAETLDPLAAGGVMSIGTFGGQGGQTKRIPNAADWASYTPASLATETARPVRQSRVLGYHDVTVGAYGLEFANTYDGQIFSLRNVAGALSATAAIQGGPAFAANLMRSLLGTAIAGITASVGSSANDTSLDTLIAAASAFNVNASDPANMGAPVLVMHPQQVEHVKESARAEGAFQDSSSWNSIQGVELGQVQGNFMGLGMNLIRTNAVTTASSAYQGALYTPGAVQAMFGDTGLVEVPAGIRSIRIPALGILIQELTEGAAQRTSEVQYYQYVGVAMADTATHKQTRVLGST